MVNPENGICDIILKILHKLNFTASMYIFYVYTSDKKQLTLLNQL